MTGQVVTLEFKGEAGDAVSAMGEVGAASKSMSGDVGASSQSLRDTGAATDELADKAGGAEQKFIGFKDTITGTGDVITGFREGSVLTMAQGFADIAGGLESFLIPMLGRLGGWIMGTAAAQWVLNASQTVGTAITGALSTAMGILNTVMRANPILFIVGLIALLVGAFIYLWNNSEGFRNFFIGMWNGIKTAVGAVVDWIKGAWNGMISFFTTLVKNIGDIFSGIGNAIKSAFKTAINFVIDLLNLAIGAVNLLIRGINLVPGVDIPEIPKIKKFHAGGVVPGPPGSEMLAMLRGGEVVSPSGASTAGGNGRSGGGRLRIAGNGDSMLAEFLMELERIGILQWESA